MSILLQPGVTNAYMDPDTGTLIVLLSSVWAFAMNYLFPDISHTYYVISYTRA